ncbi:MAG TPA: helix-turn-helix domain-containing protein [Candidatus Limnocylindrales bacterium]
MTRRGEATRTRLIEATLSVAREVGYAHASTRAIAQAAGVAEGTIYRHFPDKASLFFAAVLESNGPVVAWVTTLPDLAGQGTVEGNLTEVAVRLATLRDQIIPLELAIAADPELAAQRQRILAEAGTSLPGPPEAVAAYLAAEQRLGRVRPEIDPREAAVLILAALFGLAADQSIGDPGLDRDRLASAVRLLVRGIQL